MINENKTFEEFGYTSNKLTHGSNKMVCAICEECGREKLLRMSEYTLTCGRCLKCSKQHVTKETRQKMSNAQSRKCLSIKTRQKISKNHKGTCIGNKNPNWKGGKRLATARENARRKKLFGFIPHNLPQENFHGHHLDFNHVIFIPMELHQSIRHSVTRNINMDLINDIACNWFLNDQLPSNIC